MARPAPQTDARTAAELIKITTCLATERDLDALLHMVVTSARLLTGAEAGRVYTLDTTKRNLLLRVEQNERVETSPGHVEPVALFKGDERDTSSVCAYCAFSGRLVNIGNVYRYTGFDFDDLYRFDELTGYRTRSLVAVPLRSHEDLTLGVLVLINARDPGTGKVRPFPPDAEEVVGAFASQAAVALDNAELIHRNRQLIEVLDQTNRQLEAENQRLKDRVLDQPRFAIIGRSPALERVFGLIDKVAESDVSVLLRGETGTGKELFASAIHRASGRADGPFVAQNCAALPENLLESELFGYRKGAFSGAVADKRGLIEAADGGTLFLDEIGDMPVSLQPKLLRVLQESEVRPLGALEGRKVNVRVIAATHRDLEGCIADGGFREDLFYRLAVFPIELPPLRDRAEDIPALLQHFLSGCRERFGKRVGGFAPAAMNLLMAYRFPGNVRELRNVVERAVLMCEDGGSILPEHLPDPVRRAPRRASVDDGPADGAAIGPVDEDAGLKDLVQRFEAQVLARRLQALGWNQTRAAQALGISRRTLIDKMNAYGIRPGGRRGEAGEPPAAEGD
jgi:sigma-54-dependent transcriptional regulator